MKIIHGALAVVTALVCPGLAEASDDGRLRGKISTLHANAAEKRFMTRPRRKIPPAVSDTAARVPAALHASAAEKMFMTRPRRKIPPAVVEATARGPAVSAHGTKTKTGSKAEEHHLDDAYVGLKEDSAVGSLKDMATYSPTGVPVPMCDWATEELCYDGALLSSASTCVAYADGGCPCAEGEVKCGADDDWSGYCTAVCCDSETEQICFDDDYNLSCAAIAEGGCPCPEGEEKCNGWCQPAGESCENDACYESWSPLVECVADADTEAHDCWWSLVNSSDGGTSCSSNCETLDHIHETCFGEDSICKALGYDYMMKCEECDCNAPNGEHSVSGSEDSSVVSGSEDEALSHAKLMAGSVQL